MDFEKLKERMKGVHVVQTTPFNKDDSLDIEGMRSNTRWLMKNNAGKNITIVPLGSTGEFYALSDDETKAVIEMVVKEVNGMFPVIVGAARASTRETIKMCRLAEAAGADGVQIVLPYYHIPEEEGLYQHFKQVAESIKISITVYNNPATTGSWVKPELMVKLSKIPNIIALKENTPDVRAFYKMRRALDPKDMVILAGLGGEMYSF
jgi:4-hydroxy-tetrahydrodipicolinate synthase